ncbi:MAG: maleylpyruvate isomerase family mycothiol-dependent enzyme [Acidimicrobiales bacterium]
MGTWELAATARTDFADMVEPLSDEQLGQQTLCNEWDAKGVLAHLVMFTELGAVSFFTTIAKKRFDIEKAWLAAAAERRERPTADLIATLRQKATASAPLPGFPEGMTVADVAIHTQDVRRPLGLSGSLNEEVVATALEFLATSKQAKQLVAPPALDGLSLHATDLGWKHGDGAEVAGTGEAIMMALAHRPVLDELSGEGVAQFASRV